MAKKHTKKEIAALRVGDQLTREGIEIRKTFKGAVYYAEKQVSGKRVRVKLGAESAGFNLTLARSALVKIASEYETRTSPVLLDPKTTFREAAKIYIDGLKATQGKQIKQKMQQIRMHLDPFFGSMTMEAISTFDIEKFCAKRQNSARAPKPATINRELATFRHIYRKLGEWGMISTSVPRFKELQEDNQRTSSFTQTQIKAALVAAKNDSNPHTYWFLLIGFSTSMRHKEIVRIRFRDIDFQNHILRIPLAKRGSRDAILDADLAGR